MSRTEVTKDKAFTVYTYGQLQLDVMVYSNGFNFALDGVAASPAEVREALRKVIRKDYLDTIPGIMVGLYYEAAKLAKEQGWSDTYKLAVNHAQQAYTQSLN